MQGDGRSCLPNDKGEQQVDERCDGLAGGARLQELDLCSVQPGQGAPGPGVRTDVEAHEEERYPGGVLADPGHVWAACARQRQRAPNAHLTQRRSSSAVVLTAKHQLVSYATGRMGECESEHCCRTEGCASLALSSSST